MRVMLSLCQVAFGYETSVQAGENAEFYEEVKGIFGSNTFFGNLFSTLATIFPEAKSVFRAALPIRNFKLIERHATDSSF